MSGEAHKSGDGYALYRLPAGGFDIVFRGDKIGRLVRGDLTGWVALLTNVAPQGEMPPPFVRHEYTFKSLVEALNWMDNPPVKQQTKRNQR